LLIFDEVFTGMGRIGSLTTAAEVLPDLSCFGKALGGGMPVSAVAGTLDAMSAWPESVGEAIHTGTFFGHPLSCAVAEATLSAVIEDGLCERSRSLGDWALHYLRTKLAGPVPQAQVRGKGLMIGIDLGPGARGIDIVEDLANQGVIVIPSGPNGRVVSITPALNIPEHLFQAGLDQVVACTADAVRQS
jgi:4-aminobutyrate aminotransferase/(S)-3-amino-2-methylpropionate transaminase